MLTLRPSQTSDSALVSELTLLVGLAGRRTPVASFLPRDAAKLKDATQDGEEP